MIESRGGKGRRGLETTKSVGVEKAGVSQLGKEGAKQEGQKVRWVGSGSREGSRQKM